MKYITVESGQNIIDIAIQEYGRLEAVETVWTDNNLAQDAELYPGQQLLIREAGIDDIPVTDGTVMAVYSSRAAKDKNGVFLVNSRSPSADDPAPPAGPDLPSFYGSGPVEFDDTELITIYRGKKQADLLPFVADMERLWYVYPQAFGLLSHAFQNGGYDAISSFDLLTVTLHPIDADVDYYAYRLNHDTYLTEADSFKISFA
jgi:hypothetical protein